MSISKIDWSRQSRKRLKLLEYDTEKCLITSFLEISNEISEIMKQNKHLLQLIHTKFKKEEPRIKELDVPSILNKLLSNAYKNSKQIPNHRRFEEVLKKFATSLLIYAGPLSYRFVAHALPSLRTIQRNINKEYIAISEGEFIFDGLLEHLHNQKCPLIVSIGEDATRIIAKVDYDESTDRLVGFALPTNKESGLLITDAFLASSFEAIESHFQNSRPSKYALLYMAQPLSPVAPAFILACLGTDNRFSTEHVLKRWAYIREECSKRGISVISHGDTRALLGMKHSTNFFEARKSNKCLPARSAQTSLTLYRPKLQICNLASNVNMAKVADLQLLLLMLVID